MAAGAAFEECFQLFDRRLQFAGRLPYRILRLLDRSGLTRRLGRGQCEARLLLQVLHGLREFPRVLRRDGDGLARVLHSIAAHGTGDPAIVLRRDRHHAIQVEVGVAEFLQQPYGPVSPRTADAQVFRTKLLPCQIGELVFLFLPNTVEAMGLGRGTASCDPIECLLAPQAGSQIDCIG